MTTIELIKMFKVVPCDKNTELLDPVEVNDFAARVGYLVHPDACTQDVMDFLEDQKLDLDSTFYKSWASVTSKTRRKIWMDQIIHYTISYRAGEVWTPEETSNIPAFNTYKVILPATEQEVFAKCMNMLKSGIALKSVTMMSLVDYICEHFTNCTSVKKFEVDVIRNREAQTVLCSKLNIFPKDKFNLLRYIYYTYSGTTLIIHNNDSLSNLMSNCGRELDLSQLDEYRLRGLASIFYRFKWIFLAIRRRHIHSDSSISKSNIKIINMLNRMAKKYHQPMEIGFWEKVLSTPSAFPYKELRGKLNEISNFKIITLLQAIAEKRAIAGGLGPNLYIIRNGKAFLKESDSNAIDSKYDYWDDLYKILYIQLIRNLSAKAGTVRYPKNLNLACPTSEKNFMGDVPFGSYYDIAEKDNVFGITWRGEDGAQDLDLSYSDYKGNKFGWNANYYDVNNTVIYSGDMIRANPSATELMYMAHDCPNGYLKVNLYNGKLGSKYKLFFANYPYLDPVGKNPIVNPNHIKTAVDLEATGDQMVAVICDKRVYLMSLNMGDNRVSSAAKNDDWDKIFKRKAKTFLSLSQVLKDAGFKEVKKVKEDETIDYDFTELNRDTLIDLFS